MYKNKALKGSLVEFPTKLKGESNPGLQHYSN